MIYVLLLCHARRNNHSEQSTSVELHINTRAVLKLARPMEIQFSVLVRYKADIVIIVS